MDLKRCNKCGIEKPKSEFYIRKGEKEPYRNDCRQCISARGQERYLSHKDEIKGKVKSYCLANRETKIDYAREYYRANKEEVRKKQAIYNAENKEAIAERKAKRHQELKPEMAAFRLAHPRAHWANQTTYKHYIHSLYSEVLAMAERTELCPICNCKLKYAGGETVAWHSASLDRRFNDHSKSIDNFWIVCRRCNTTKRDRSMEEMDEWCLQWQKVRQGAFHPQFVGEPTRWIRSRKSSNRFSAGGRE